MTAEYTGFGSPKFTSADFARDEPELETTAFNPTPIYARERQTKRGPNPLILAIVPAVLVAGGVLAWAMMDGPKDELMTSTAAPPAAPSTPAPVAEAEPTPMMAPETPAVTSSTMLSFPIRPGRMPSRLPATGWAISPCRHRPTSPASS